MDKYENEGVVGEGSYGVVLKCRQKETGRIVAIKKFLETDADPTVKKIAMREIRMLKRLRHENLINLIEVFRRRRKLFLVFEFVDHTVLEELEENPRGLQPQMVRERLFQVLRGIDFCHQNNIIHRDVKPENVLVSNSGVVKLCDFGFARLMAAPGEAYTDYVATRWYRAPELLVADPQYGREVDVWAIGCLLAEMRTGDPLFPGESDIDQLYLISQMLGPLCNRHRQLIARNPLFYGLNIQNTNPNGLRTHYTNWPEDALDLLEQSLTVDPLQRPSAAQLLNASFFTRDNFHLHFPLQIKMKIEHEFGNANRKLLSDKKRSSNVIPPAEDELLRQKAKKDRTFRRKSDTFDSLLGGGVGTNLISQPQVIGTGVRTAMGSLGPNNIKSNTIAAKKIYGNNKSSINNHLVTVQERNPSAISDTHSISPIRLDGLHENNEEESGENTPTNLKRYDGFEQDLNKIGARSARSQNNSNRVIVDSHHGTGGNALGAPRNAPPNNSASNKPPPANPRPFANSLTSNQLRPSGEEAFRMHGTTLDARLNFETAFDRNFHIEEIEAKSRPLQQQQQQQQQLVLSEAKLSGRESKAVKKKRKQMDPISLPSVAGASKLHVEGLKTLPRRRLGLNLLLEPEQNDENHEGGFSRPGSHNLPLV